MAIEKKKKSKQTVKRNAQPSKKTEETPAPQKNFDDGVNALDLPSRYLRDHERMLFLSEEVDDKVVNRLIIEMKYLEALDPEKDIHLYIDSPGGAVTDGLNLCHFMKNLKCDVATHAMGIAASMAAVILSCGAKGKRFVQPNSTVMLHHLKTINSDWQCILDAEIRVGYAKRLDDILVKLLSENTGVAERVLRNDIERDNYLIGEEAVKYGVADSVE